MKIMRFEQAPDVLSVSVRVHPIDVGWDPRSHGMQIEVPPDCDRATYEQDGERWYVEGSRDEIVATLESAGYLIAD